MSEEDEKRTAAQQYQQAQHYGTFQPYYGQPQPQPQPQPYVGFPQPVPPPSVAGGGPPVYPPHPSSFPPQYPPQYYAHAYQGVPAFPGVAEGRPLRMPRLPCCGLGIGWFLFIIGFFLAAIPWYVGAFILLCVRVDYREKPGFVACTIAAVLAAIAVIFGVTKGADDW